MYEKAQVSAGRLDDGLAGVLVSTWSAFAPVGSFKLTAEGVRMRKPTRERPALAVIDEYAELADDALDFGAVSPTSPSDVQRFRISWSRPERKVD